MKTNFKFIYLTAILLLMFSSVTFGQVYKLKTTSFTSMFKINEYKWSEWSDWEETSVLITIDLTKERVTIYSKEIQEYDIIEYEEVTYDKEGDKTVPFICVNKDGLKCRVRLIRLYSKDETTQLYVDFSDVKWAYNYYSLD